jgi:hypothetical protein
VNLLCGLYAARSGTSSINGEPIADNEMVVWKSVVILRKPKTNAGLKVFYPFGLLSRKTFLHRKRS